MSAESNSVHCVPRNTSKRRTVFLVRQFDTVASGARSPASSGTTAAVVFHNGTVLVRDVDFGKRRNEVGFVFSAWIAFDPNTFSANSVKLFGLISCMQALICLFHNCLSHRVSSAL